MAIMVYTLDIPENLVEVMVKELKKDYSKIILSFDFKDFSIYRAPAFPGIGVHSGNFKVDFETESDCLRKTYPKYYFHVEHAICETYAFARAQNFHFRSLTVK